MTLGIVRQTNMLRVMLDKLQVVREQTSKPKRAATTEQDILETYLPTRKQIFLCNSRYPGRIISCYVSSLSEYSHKNTENMYIILCPFAVVRCSLQSMSAERLMLLLYGVR